MVVTYFYLTIFSRVHTGHSWQRSIAGSWQCLSGRRHLRWKVVFWAIMLLRKLGAQCWKNNNSASKLLKGRVLKLLPRCTKVWLLAIKKKVNQSLYYYWKPACFFYLTFIKEASGMEVSCTFI